MVYGVKKIKGKLFVEAYEKEEDVPKDENIVKPEDLQDYLEKNKG